MSKSRLSQFAGFLLLVIAFGSTAAIGQVTDKPVVHWKYDEGTGTTTEDAMGNAGISTFSTGMDASAWVDGKMGKALTFDGVDDKMTLPYDSLTFDYTGESFSVSCWVNFASTNVDRKSRIITYGTFMLAQTYTEDADKNPVEGTGVMKLQVKNMTGSKLTFEVTDSAFWKDEWVLMTFVRDVETQSVAFYSNDELIASKTYGDAFLEWDFKATDDLVHIAASSNPDPAKFQGAIGIIDDLRMYDVALTEDQVADLNDGIADMLMAYWPFDEESGTNAPDESGNGNDGTTGGMVDTNWVEGKLFNALEFDAVDDYVKVPYDESLEFGNGSFSISMWVNAPVPGILGRWMSFGSLILRQNSDNTVGFRADVDGVKTEFFVPEEKFVGVGWVLVTAVRDTASNELKLYANTELIGSKTEVPDGSFTNAGDDKACYIGANNDAKRLEGKHQGTKGMLDEVRLFNTALTAEQILAIYAEGNTDYYDLTVAATTNGSVELSPAGGTYPGGTVVTLTAAADDGYHFESWGGDLSGSDIVTTLTMDADKNVSATFAVGGQQFKLSITQDGDGVGYVARSTADTLLDQGTEVTLTAVAVDGNVFAGWTGDIEGLDKTITFIMNGDVSVNATFMSDGPEYDIVVSQQAYESTDTSGLNYTNDTQSPIWTNNPGYTGDGFYDWENFPGGMIEWTVPITTAGPYIALFRYAHGGSGGDRPVKIELNGVVIEESHSLLNTGAWTIWKKEEIEVNLVAGDNTIKLTALGADGMVNLDKLEIANLGTSIQDVSMGVSSFNVYPNPSTDITNISYKLEENSVVNIEILDISGRMVKRVLRERQSPGDFKIQLSISDLNSGLYIVKLSAGQSVQTSKLNVQ